MCEDGCSKTGYILARPRCTLQFKKKKVEMWLNYQ